MIQKDIDMNGNAHVIPFVEYLAGLASGRYSIVSNPSRTRAPYNVLNLEDQQTKGAAVLSISSHPSIPSRVSNASILKAIQTSEQLITSEDELLSYLSYTKSKTFGFFSIENESHLVMLVPEEYSLSRSYSYQLIGTS